MMPFEIYAGPVEQHPATRRLRTYIAALETLPETEERNAALAYAKQELARFDAGVYEYRAREYVRHRREIA